MPRGKRIPTTERGIFVVEGRSRSTGEPDRFFYVRYYTADHKLVEDCIGSASRGMTLSKAKKERIKRLSGKISNREQRRLQREKAERPTLGRLWALYQESKGGKYPSLNADRSNFKHLESFARKEPHEIPQLAVDGLRIRLGKKKKPQTVKHVLNLLQKLIRFGVRKRLCPDPGLIIEKPRVNNIKDDSLSREQLQRLRKALDDEPDQQVATLVKMVLLTGCRRGELFKLKWSDLDFAGGWITLRSTKSGRDQKKFMSAEVRALLENHPRVGGSEYVFPGRWGGQRTEARAALNRIRKAAGLPPGTRPLHSLRHTIASLLASSGSDLYSVGHFLSHRSISMTARYSHLSDGALKRTADLAGELVSRIGESLTNQVTSGINEQVKGGR
jgi:integrase